MKRFSLFLSFAVMLFPFLPLSMRGQERVVQMPNRDQLMSAHVRVLFQDSEGYMWYGMKSDGLYRDDGYHLTSFRADFLHPEVQMNNNIMALCEDKFNRIWIGTKRGLYILDKRDYSIRPTGDQKLQIWTIEALKPSLGDSVWAYANNHLLVYDRNGNCIRQTPMESNPLVTPNRKEITDKRGNVWQIDDFGIPTIKTHPALRMKEVNLDTLSLQCMVPTSRAGALPPGQKAHVVWNDKNGTKWIATNSGLSMVRPDSDLEEVGPYFGVVNALTPAEDGSVYMNTEWQGLINYKNGGITQMDTTIRNASALFLDKKDLWICTSDGRLLLYDVEKKQIDDKSATCCLRGDAPWGLVVLKGYVWVLFNQRILLYSPTKNVLHHIFPSDLEPKPLFFRGIYTDGDNRLFLECEEKAYELLITCDTVSKNVEAKATLSAYQTIHGTYCVGLNPHQLHLKADERVVHLFFTTFDHLNTKHIRYAFRRKGETEWQYLGLGDNDVLITKLSNGDNVVEVKTTNSDGEWGEEITTITIHCDNYWWKTTWACIVFIVLAAALIAFFIWLSRKLKLTRRHKKQ